MTLLPRPVMPFLLVLLVLATAGCQANKSLRDNRCRDQVKGKDGVGCSCVYYRDEQAIYQPVPNAQIRYCLNQPDFDACLCGGTPRPFHQQIR